MQRELDRYHEMHKYEHEAERDIEEDVARYNIVKVNETLERNTNKERVLEPMVRQTRYRRGRRN